MPWVKRQSAFESDLINYESTASSILSHFCWHSALCRVDACNITSYVESTVLWDQPLIFKTLVQ